ncbi:MULTISPECIES: hypothetical protein [unclassified Ekhidna]|jgi:hypothetical protein|uniref:hypothetical protein n=1 Tax=unclassified Ekhidna TaxID=2632188 RepID=UPI0032DE76BA
MSTIQSNFVGMTIMQRLKVTGQYEAFKKALKKNKASAIKMLEALNLDQKSIENFLKSKL